MTLLDFIAIILCTDAIMTAWFYSELFDRPLNYFKELKDKGYWFLGTLFTCVLCLSYHAAFWVTVLLWLPGLFLDAPWDMISRIPLYSLAATSVVHFLQQVRPFSETENEHDSERISDHDQDHS